MSQETGEHMDFHAENHPGRLTGMIRSARRGQSVVVAALVFLGLMWVNVILSPYPLSYFDVSFLASGGATTAIAAAGQTLVIISGDFDLSAGGRGVIGERGAGKAPWILRTWRHPWCCGHSQASQSVSVWVL